MRELNTCIRRRGHGAIDTMDNSFFWVFRQTFVFTISLVILVLIKKKYKKNIKGEKIMKQNSQEISTNKTNILGITKNQYL